VSQRTNALVVLSGLLHASGQASTQPPPSAELLSQLASVLVRELAFAAFAHEGEYIN